MLRGRTRREFRMQSCKLFMALADLGVSRILRKLAAVLFTLSMKGRVFFAHGRLQQQLWRQLALSLAPCWSLQRQQPPSITAIVTIPNPTENRAFFQFAG